MIKPIQSHFSPLRLKQSEWNKIQIFEKLVLTSPTKFANGLILKERLQTTEVEYCPVSGMAVDLSEYT
jgi:hypothetical protein